METIEKNEVGEFFFGMRRSGNHAVLDWILAHQKRPFYNNCVLKGDQILTAQMTDGEGIGIASFEDADLDHMFRRLFAKPKILLIRDPYNLFASRLARVRKTSEPDPPYVYIDMICKEAFRLWKQHFHYWESQEAHETINFNLFDIIIQGIIRL